MESVLNAISLVQHAVDSQPIAQIANLVSNLIRAQERVHPLKLHLHQVAVEVKIIRLYAQIPKPTMKRHVNA
jgi:hypothetical protein